MLWFLIVITIKLKVNYFHHGWNNYWIKILYLGDPLIFIWINIFVRKNEECENNIIYLIIYLLEKYIFIFEIFTWIPMMNNNTSYIRCSNNSMEECKILTEWCKCMAIILIGHSFPNKCQWCHQNHLMLNISRKIFLPKPCPNKDKWVLPCKQPWPPKWVKWDKECQECQECQECLECQECQECPECLECQEWWIRGWIRECLRVCLRVCHKECHRECLRECHKECHRVCLRGCHKEYQMGNRGLGCVLLLK